MENENALQNANTAQETTPVTATGNGKETQNCGKETNPIPQASAVPNQSAEQSDPNKKTYSQDELDKLFSERSERAKKSAIEGILKKYSCESEEDLASKVKEAESYSLLKPKIEELRAAKQQLAMRENDIDPSKIEDISFYFKGKGIELNSENLKKELENPNHKSWVLAKEQPKAETEKKPPEPKIDSGVFQMGNNQNDRNEEDMDAYMAKIFGLKNGFHK